MGLLLLSLLFFLSPALAVWPLPRSFANGTTYLSLGLNFSINAASNFTDVPLDVLEAVNRTMGFLREDKLEVLAPRRGAEYANSIASARTLDSLTYSLTPEAKVQNISADVLEGLGAVPEDYVLTIPGTGGVAQLTAKSALGLLRGLTTFEQLWYYWNDTTYMFQAPVNIADSPAYPYRGLMLDTARNFFPVKDIMRTLDAMSMVKMNYFHWHAVDSQSFPLRITGFEELAEKGAYSSDEIYTPDDVKQIVGYAAARGINVMLEIDTPAHTSAIYYSHPEHIQCIKPTPWREYANGQLSVTNPATINFTASMLTAAASVFPSKLFSTGGDEVNLNCYAQELKSTPKAMTAVGKFVQALHSALAKVGKTPVVWEEMVLDYGFRPDKDTIVIVWRKSSGNVARVAQRQYRIIHASSDFFYLDCGAGGWEVGDNQPSWCDPFKTWQKAYSFNPIDGLSGDQVKLVMGGESLLWSEQSSPSNLDPIVWPRAAASAEVFWSGDKRGSVKDALLRLQPFRYRMVQRDIRAIPLGTHWCAVNGHACDIDA